MNVLVDTTSGQHGIRGGALIALLAGSALALSACGPNGNPYQGTYGPNPPASGSTASPPPPPPASGSTVPVPGLAAEGDMIDGFNYTDDTASGYGVDTPIPLDDVTIKILPPIAGGGCHDKQGDGFGPGLDSGKKDYSGCTLAMVDTAVARTGCPNLTAPSGSPAPAYKDIASPDFKPYVRVLFSAADYKPSSSLTWNATMKMNGQSTRCATQKGYKVQLGKNLSATEAALVQPWRGQMDVLLKKHPYDLTRIRNQLAFYLFRSVPDFSSRATRFLNVSVIGANASPLDPTTPNPGLVNQTQAFGLFEDIEEEDDGWLTVHGQDPKGQFWKIRSFTFEPIASTPGLAQCAGQSFDVPDTCADTDAFQDVIEEQGNHYSDTNLFKMLDALNDNLDFLSVNGYTNNFETVFHTYFHPDNFRTWLAANILVDNEDTNSQNFYLYEPSTRTQFYFTPWDYDGAWDWYNQAGSQTPRPRWTEGLSNWWGMVLVRRYIEAPGEIEKLNSKIQELQQKYINANAVQGALGSVFPMTQIDQIESELPDNQFPDVSVGNKTETKEQLRTAEVNRLADTIAVSYQRYETSLKRPMPLFQDVEVTGGLVNLSWDPSWIIRTNSSNGIVYDVTLATSPDLGSTDPGCTASDTPVSQLSDGVVKQWTGLSATDVNAPQLDPGQYYLQVIARDASTNYCQIGFDQYEDASGKSYFGVYAFKYDGTKATYDGD